LEGPRRGSKPGRALTRYDADESECGEAMLQLQNVDHRKR
jgi:hypothetical protein